MQFAISIAVVLLVSVICFYTVSFIGYTVVALLLLMTASVIAMLFDILPVLTAAVLSAMIWNFFFIPPVYTFHIEKAEDLVMFFLYFLIALVNTVLTFKIRDAEGKARDKEEKVNTIKLYNTLLNSLSHELRTPIATIIGAVDTLQEGQDKLSMNSKSELLKEIDRASIRLNRQVENLLSMSRLETGMLRLNIDWCDINELIHSVIQKVSETSSRKVDFSANEKLPLFKVDRGLMEQVLQNLIHNAILYTPENTIIEIEVIHRRGVCVLIVSDHGHGFPEKEIQFAFDKFYRLPQTKVGGSGLGLSIVKGFVEAHQGSVTLSNRREGGAVFTVEIPTETSFLTNLKNE